MVDCWAQNGELSPDNRKYAPCNTTAIDLGGHSTCCAIGDLCLTNGMCKDPKERDNSNKYFRKACTDKSWKDPACPQICEDIEPNRNTSLVYHCQQKESWCCAYVGEKGFKDWPKHDLINTTCCSIPDLTFKTQDPTVFATALLYIRPSDLVSIQPSSNTEFSSISLAKTGTGMDITGLPTADSNGSSGENVQQGSSTGLSTGAKIGLGVGIPIAIIGLAAIGAIFCLRKRRATGAKDTPELFAPDASNKHNVPPCQETAMDHHGGTTYRHEAPSPNTAAELPATDNMAELPSQSKPLI